MNSAAKHLAKARVHVGGAGRIGGGMVLALATAGVGYISCNDPQSFEDEQLSSCVFSRRSDLGRPKVHVLERFLDGRPSFTFEPIKAPNQSPKIEPYIAQADLIISCANDLQARLYLEQAAVRLNKPSMQVCAQDARHAVGGLISIWTSSAKCSCFGCLFPEANNIERGELLLHTVTSTIANLAAHLAVEVLCGNSKSLSHNVLAVDLTRLSIERLFIEPRVGCQICGPNQEAP